MAFISEYQDINDFEDIVATENEGDDLLIDLVSERPWLYDKSTKGYSDQIMTFNAWKDISTVMNDTVENCKSRWKKILNHYSREKLQLDKESRSGSAASRRPTWPLYERMKSLLQTNPNKFNISYTNVKSPAGDTQYPQKCFVGKKQQKKPNNQRTDMIQSLFDNVNATVHKFNDKLYAKPEKEKSIDDPDALFGMLIEAELNELDSKEAKKT